MSEEELILDYLIYWENKRKERELAREERDACIRLDCDED